MSPSRKTADSLRNWAIGLLAASTLACGAATVKLSTELADVKENNAIAMKTNRGLVAQRNQAIAELGIKHGDPMTCVGDFFPIDFTPKNQGGPYTPQEQKQILDLFKEGSDNVVCFVGPTQPKGQGQTALPKANIP